MKSSVTTSAMRALLLAVVCFLSSCGSGDKPQSTALRASIQTGVTQSPSLNEHVDLIQMIYVGYFGRAADPAGLAYFAKLFADHDVPVTPFAFSQSYHTNPAVRSTVDAFGASEESLALYPPGDDDAFVTAIYANMFNRTPDVAGKTYWVDLLKAKTISRGSAAVVIMAGALSTDMTSIRNKAKVATSFTALLDTPERIAAYSGSGPNAVVREMLKSISDTTDLTQQPPVLDALVQRLLAMAAAWPAPVNVKASGLSTISAGRAYITFDAVPPKGTLAPAGYVASCSHSTDVKSAWAMASPVLVEGLRNGEQYTCSVRVDSVGDRSAAVALAVPAANPNHLRFIYAIPTDRLLNQQWANAIAASAADLQHWFRGQLNGKTFTVFAAQPQICRLPRASAAYFSSNTWNQVANDIIAHCGVQLNKTDTDWIVYADVLHDVATPGRLGAGAVGLAQFPRQDLEGLGGAPCTMSDEGVEYCNPQTRWVGGAGHEIAHTLGVPHPAGCDQNLPTCDNYARSSIMWSGYAAFPATYFTPESIEILLKSRFIR